MADYQLRGERCRMEGKVQGLRSTIGKYKIDRGMLKTVEDIEKPKNLYARPMDIK